LEIGVESTGDFAVEWVIYYLNSGYTKDLKPLLRTRQSFLKLILKTSQECNISRATPYYTHWNKPKPLFKLTCEWAYEFRTDTQDRPYGDSFMALY